MNLDHDIALTIQRFHLASLNWHREISEILSEPLHARVWDWWTALAYFKEGNTYERLEDAPEGQDCMVMDGIRTYYRWEDGWVLGQTMTKDECKDIYG